MQRNNDSAMHWTALGLIVLACLLPWIPQSAQRIISSGIRDAMVPGQLAWNATASWGSDQLEHIGSSDLAREEIAELERELSIQTHRNRQLSIQNAELNEQLSRDGNTSTNPFVATDSEPLFVPQLIQANVFGRSAPMDNIRRLLIQQGKDEGIEEELIVVDAGLTLLDQGRAQGLDIGQPVYSGASVVGRVESVGQWVSSIVLVTDESYRGRAQLARQTSRGLIFGSEGRIEGQGTELCRLHEVPATESVAVGDQVFSGERNGALKHPLHYGTVVRAELPEGAEEWLIEIQPSQDFERLESVAVLREAVNASRVLGN